uniref:uncharacterized protein LOC122601039 n=1 Tax=Erigeron canadensis TaxID=72917 RepID=UPI001CB89E2C|nr:uncharacterized protein LOC122601039 [Erigeron canadensis]
MHQMGFPNRWCTWIYGMLSSARASILVNGAPTFEFQSGKGLRQGDPISPFLFLLVMEGFSCLINKATASGSLEGLKLPKNGPVISHLLYADDCTFVGDWSMNNLYKVARALRVFFLCSGLKINLGKSNLFGIGVDDMEVKNAAAVFKCKEGTLLFKYLGLRIGANMNRISSWDFLFEVFESRLATWKAKTLSIGGRSSRDLKQSLDDSFGVDLKKKEKSIGLPGIVWLKHGGLGLSKLEDSNIALLTKWIWRYRNEENALWRMVINSIHGGGRGWNSVPINKSLASEALDEWFDFRNLLDEIIINEEKDKWVWTGASNKLFSVKSVKKFLQKGKDYSDRFVFKWAKGVTKKCNIFVWRAAMDRIPTYKAFQVRNCNFGTSQCAWCETEEETIEHLLCLCLYSMEVWSKIAHWCKIGTLIFSSVRDMIESYKNVGLGKNARTIFKNIVFVSCWCLWKAMNEKIFDKVKFYSNKVLFDIKTIGFLWFREDVREGKGHQVTQKEAHEDYKTQGSDSGAERRRESCSRSHHTAGT